MSEFFLYAGGLIIAGLSAVAIYLNWRLYQVKKQIKAREAEVERQRQLGRQHLNQSIQIICRALLDGQVEYAEASLRVSKLMDQLSVGGSARGGVYRVRQVR
ncbi:MAG: DUF2489 domain-containing protein [Cellvibrionaceae bacterium]|nr:DUF2489 domain-containing protein [Cellvibrionaceae bacterium]